MTLNIGRSFAVVLITVLFSFVAFYSPQPLLPLISTDFSVPPTTSATLFTIPFLFLCFSPILYGALLNAISARTILIAATLALALTQLIFVFADDFKWLIASRTLQAILFPAIFTASVTYCSKAGPASNIQQRVSLYIASTIIGGLCGRLFSGFVTSEFGWPTIFVLNTITLLICAALLYFITEDRTSHSKIENIKMLGSIISDRTFLSGYLLVFTTFYAFSATLNVLPFRLVDIEPSISPARISLVYLGYILGVVIATSNQKLTELAGGRVRAMTIALTCLLVGIVMLLPANVWWLVIVGFITAGGMFLIHSTLSGFLTSLKPEQASLINGLYISIYYGAGAIGSIVPVWIYHHSGWQVFLLSIFAVAISGFFTLSRLAIHSNRRKNTL